MRSPPPANSEADAGIVSSPVVKQSWLITLYAEYLRSQNMSYSSSVAVLSAGRVLGALLSLATAMVLSRLLTRAEYGTYQQIWLVYNTIAPLFILGLPAGVVYYTSQADAGGRKMIVRQTTLLLALAGLAIGAIMYCFSDALAAQFGGRSLGGLIRLFALFPVFTLPLSFVDSFLITIDKAKAAALFGILSNVVQYGAAVLPVALGAGLQAAVLALDAVAVARFAVVALIFAIATSSVASRSDSGFAARLLRYAIPLGVSGILGTVMMQLGRVIVATFCGVQEYAVYVNGATELPFVGIITGSVMSVVTPAFVRLLKDGQDEEVIRLWHSATRKVALLFFPLTAVLMVYGPDLIILLFSERYAESSSVFRIFLLLLPLRITVYGSLLMAAGKSHLILMASGLALVLSVALNLVLIPLIGLDGAALATVAAVYLQTGWQLHWCTRLLGCRWREVFPWPALARLAIVSALAAALTWLCTAFLPRGPLRIGVGSLLFAALAGPLFWFFTDERQSIYMLKFYLFKYVINGRCV